MEPPEYFDSAENTILRWDSTASKGPRSSMIFDGSRQEIYRYLRAVDEIQRSMVSCAISDDKNKLHTVILIAMARLEDEFRSILLSRTYSLREQLPTDPSASTSSSHSAVSSRTSSSLETIPVHDELDFSETLRREFDHQKSGNISYRSTNRIREIDLLPPDAVYDLRRIAGRMITAGYAGKCAEVYVSVRKLGIDASFRRLGIEKLSKGDIESLEWEVLDKKIKIWIPAAKVAVRTLFASEKKLRHHIFEGFGIANDFFVETIERPAIELFNFAEAISISLRSPKKLFKMLDLHDTLSELIPVIDIVFEPKSSELIRVQAVVILSRLADAARGILSEFENAVLRKPSRVIMPGGTIHPFTSYVMNYINLISVHKPTLNLLIVSKPSTGSWYSGDAITLCMDLTKFEWKTALELHLIWIIEVLQFNLDGKSKQYEDVSLSHLFRMNNLHYILQQTERSPELRGMIGDDYLKKLSKKCGSAADDYRRSTWTRVLSCLKDEGRDESESFSSDHAFTTALRERLTTFNAMFEELHRTQGAWEVPNVQLREEQRIWILDRLIPAYRRFLKRHGSKIDSQRYPKNFIKYSVRDLENAVWDFFEGSTMSKIKRRRSL